MSHLSLTPQSCFSFKYYDCFVYPYYSWYFFIAIMCITLNFSDPRSCSWKMRCSGSGSFDELLRLSGLAQSMAPTSQEVWGVWEHRVVGVHNLVYRTLRFI